MWYFLLLHNNKFHYARKESIMPLYFKSIKPQIKFSLLDECIVIDLPKLDRVPSIKLDLCGALSQLIINVGWMVHAV